MASRTHHDRPLPFRTTALVVHVLLSLADGPMHAYAIMKEIARRTGGRLTPGPGAIHFTLTKLLDGDAIAESEPEGGTGEDARRRYYVLTEHGRALLAAELDALEEILAVARSKNLAVERRG
jgi:DNA-binding PadR family transcriptional regulator